MESLQNSNKTTKRIKQAAWNQLVFWLTVNIKIEC